ncbi:MAG: exo-beta-N-acetylmuramidase NamZ family protein [Candidatus Acidiferrales bacterium]
MRARYSLFFLLLGLLAGLALLAGVSRPRPAEPPPAAPPPVLAGIDVLEAEQFAPLRGKRVGLITNQSGQTSDGRRTIDVLRQAPEVTLAAVFSPEHGLEGQLSGHVGHSQDASTGMKVWSLYGRTRRPTPEMLAGLDVLVFDIQDAGVRYYTYATIMAYAMEEAAKAGVAFMVLDRPNPLNGARVDGPLLDADRLNFEGYFPLPLRHGMTVGELARLYNAENRIGAALTVASMKHWRREQWFDQTGLRWVNPSPALVSLSGNTFYPAVELLRAGDVSVGRGTEEPFEMLGAPWIDAEELASYLEARKIPGVSFKPAHFTPTSDVHADRRCFGVRLALADREALDTGRLGVELLSALWELYPSHFRLERTIRLLGSSRTMARIRAGDDPKQIVEGWKPELEEFGKLRAKYLLYE